jgi:SAM-dependent methyltransferase
MLDRLDICCGAVKPDGYVGIDISPYPYPKGEFFLGDVNKGLPFDDCSFMEVRALQAIEHTDNNNKVRFMLEVYRVLKAGGIFHAEWPPPIGSNGVANAYFYTDPTHTAWWTHGTFFCFDRGWRSADVNKDIYERGYGIYTDFKVVEIGWISEYNAFVNMVKVANEK